jgi:uncharacterized phage protein (TIGR02216 family)
VSAGLNWSALMRAGMTGLNLTPDVFWALSPAELQMMLGDPGQSAPLLRDGLETLMQAWPDDNERGVQ